jgi:hypothetical protein
MASTTTSIRHFPDRDRLSVITAVIVLAYALARFVELPSREISAVLFGSKIGFELNGQLMLLLMVAALISTGSETLIRSHPRAEIGYRRNALHWIVPGWTALGLGLLLELAPTGPVWWLGLAVSAVFLVMVLVAEYTVVDPADAAYRVASLGLTALAFIVALALFAWIRYTGTRAALSATFTAIIAGSLGLRLLMLNGATFGRSTIYASVIGLVIGEAMWAFNYWQLAPTGAGLLLLVLFYLIHGLSQQHLTAQLNRRVVIEYVVVGVVGVIIALVLARP